MSVASKQIAFLRSALMLTQEQFGNEIGYSRSYVKDIESGRVKPSRKFIEAISQKYGVSADYLITDLGGLIVNIINYMHQLSEFGIIYLYDFTDKGLYDAEKQLLQFIKSYKYLIIDGKEIRSLNHLMSKLTGQKGERFKLWEAFRDSVVARYKFIVIKNISKSGVRGKAGILRDLAREMSYSSTLIVIDKPSFIERNANHLYYWLYPIHIKERFGRINY